jgi:uncharacterized UBP type Zn finger protein
MRSGAKSIFGLLSSSKTKCTATWHVAKQTCMWKGLSGQETCNIANSQPPLPTADPGSNMASHNDRDVSISTSACASGFQNPGEECYLIAILHCLSRTPQLAGNYDNTSSAIRNYLRGLAINQTIALPLELTSFFTVSGQHGAAEYLAKILNYISEGLQLTGANTPFVDDIFAGCHNSRFTCLRCGCTYQTSGVRFNHLTIPAGNFTNVSEAVAAFTAAEVQARERLWECVTCKVKPQVRRVSVASYVRYVGHQPCWTLHYSRRSTWV